MQVSANGDMLPWFCMYGIVLYICIFSILKNSYQIILLEPFLTCVFTMHNLSCNTNKVDIPGLNQYIFLLIYLLIELLM